MQLKPKRLARPKSGLEARPGTRIPLTPDGLPEGRYGNSWNSRCWEGTALLTSIDAPWLLSAVTQAAATILALGVGSLSVATVFLFRAGEFHKKAAEPLRLRLPQVGVALIGAGVSALLAVMVGSTGLLLLAKVTPVVLTALSVAAVVLLLLSAVGAFVMAYLLWRIVREVAG